MQQAENMSAQFTNIFKPLKLKHNATLRNRIVMGKYCRVQWVVIISKQTGLKTQKEEAMTRLSSFGYHFLISNVYRYHTHTIGSMHVGLEDGGVISGGLQKLGAFYAER